jgi:hypothetical protein
MVGDGYLNTISVNYPFSCNGSKGYFIVEGFGFTGIKLNFRFNCYRRPNKWLELPCTNFEFNLVNKF